MPRPPALENLIKVKALEVVRPTPGALTFYLNNADGYLVSARSIDARLTLQRFTLAYEGIFQLVQAVFEFHEVRTKDAGRKSAFQAVMPLLGLSIAEFKAVDTAHMRRNGMSYVSPFPPISMAEVEELIGILARVLPLARAYTAS